MENIHGNDVNPPRSETTDGTAVARIVASMATRPMLSITASRIGPRSLRNPTSARLIDGVAVTLGGNRTWPASVPGSVCGFLASTLRHPGRLCFDRSNGDLAGAR